MFIIYSGIMIVLLFDRNVHYSTSYTEELLRRMNFEVFATIKQYSNLLASNSNEQLIRLAFVNLAGNIVTFIPLGIFLPIIFKKQRNFILFFISCFLIISSIETAQLLTLRGIMDIDDLILNLIGVIVGYLFYLFLKLFIKTPHKHKS